MNKKLILLAAFVMTLAANAQNPLSKSLVKIRQGHPNQTVQAPSEPRKAKNQVWWGYYTSGDLSGVGTGLTETYNACIYVPNTNSILQGDKVIKGIKFWMPSSTGISNVKVWISNGLPSNVNNAAYVQDVPTIHSGSTLEECENIIELSTPYSVGYSGAYIGYSFTVTSASTDAQQHPLMFGGEDIMNAAYIRTSQKITSWTMCYGMGWGSLALQILVEGDFPSNAVGTSDFNEAYAVVNGEGKLNLPINNKGASDVSSIDYVVTSDGTDGEEQHFDIKHPISGMDASAILQVPISGAEEIGSADATVTITKVNGVANEETSNNKSNGKIITVNKLYEKRVLVEEKTGTECGWCPRGLAGMKKMRDAYGDRFVGLALHQYNPSDPMYFSDYANLGLSGAPKAIMERTDFVDPYYGSQTGENILYDCDKVLAKIAKAGIWVEGHWNEDFTKVEATAYVEGYADNANYDVVFALIADSLIGTSSSWMQRNYYPSKFGSGEGLPEDIAQFCTGGTYGQKEFFYPFEDVVIASSYVDKTNAATGISDLATNTMGHTSYTMSLPTSNTSLMSAINAIKNDKIAIVGILFDSDGNLLNCVKSYNIADSSTGIQNVNNDKIKSMIEVARYNAAGQKIYGPQKGINIIRYADGTSKKVFVKK